MFQISRYQALTMFLAITSCALSSVAIQYNYIKGSTGAYVCAKLTDIGGFISWAQDFNCAGSNSAQTAHYVYMKHPTTAAYNCAKVTSDGQIVSYTLTEVCDENLPASQKAKYIFLAGGPNGYPCAKVSPQGLVLSWNEAYQCEKYDYNSIEPTTSNDQNEPIYEVKPSTPDKNTKYYYETAQVDIDDWLSGFGPIKYACFKYDYETGEKISKVPMSKCE